MKRQVFSVNARKGGTNTKTEMLKEQSRFKMFSNRRVTEKRVLLSSNSTKTEKMGVGICRWIGGAVGVVGYACWGFIWKKAIASNSAEIQIRINPMPKRTINAAPMNISNPAVENKPTPDFAESVPSERLIKNAAIMPVIQIMMNIARSPARNGKILSRDKFDGSGVRPESVAQSPFHPGKILYMKSVNEVRTEMTTTATEITPPIIAVINP